MLETKNDIKQTSDNKITEPLYMCLQRRAEQEGLYFPRRFWVDDLSKARLFNRIENQNFKGASEEEIFRLMIINLNEIEINKCWEEMATQIKTFKRKYRKLEVKLQQKNISFQMDPLSVYESTQKVIAKSWQSSDPRDHKDLLKNLSTVIVEGRLSTASDDFNIICKQVRGCMPMHLLSSFYKQTSKGNDC